MDWIPGVKHPNSTKADFEWSRELDRIRKKVEGRCTLCAQAIHMHYAVVKELSFECDDPDHECHILGMSKSHPVCDLCFSMHRALYFNPLMRNMNYFKDLDDKEKRRKRYET